ncbi:TPA: hypothetical protein ACH3X1_003308 [Trebouxia sp. C0004]
MQTVGPNEGFSITPTAGLRTDIGPEDLVGLLTRAKDEAEEALALSELRIVEYSQQLSSTEETMNVWKKRADYYRSNCRRLTAENNDLRNLCGQLEHRLHSQQQQQKQKLADFDRNFAEETARNKDLQQKLDVLAQHLKEEDQKKSGGCTLSIVFDTQQRQDQYMEAVRSLLQPIEDNYVLNIETLQAPKPCSFLLYVTYSSSHRLVNFDNDAFEHFKQSCSTENAVILVIHRGQNDPENEEKIMSISPASGFASGLHLGTQATKLHLLQLLAYGRYGETPQLLSDSESNKQNQQLLFNLLQEILQLNARKTPQTLLQRFFGGFRSTGSPFL